VYFFPYQSEPSSHPAQGFNCPKELYALQVAIESQACRASSNVANCSVPGIVLYGTSLSPRTRYVLPNTAAGAKSNTTAEVSIVAVTVANQLFSSGSAFVPLFIFF